MKNKKHILFITSWYPSRVLPSNGDFIQRHAEAVALLHKVTVIHVVTDPNLNKTEIKDEMINGVRTLVAFIKPSLVKVFSFINAYKTLLKKAGSFDFIHINKLFPVGIIGVYYKLFEKKQYIISEHHHIYHNPYNKHIGFIEKILSRVITNQAKYVCPVSDDLGAAMQNFGLLGKYKKVPNVIFTDIFTAKKNQEKDKFSLLHVSSMDAVKNVKGILETIAELQKHIPSFLFYLIGNDSTKYKKLAHELGILDSNIVFIEEITQQELAAYYKKATVLLLFSQIETFSCVVYEAFSSGTSVISTEVGGIPEYFLKDYGSLIARNDTKQLLDAILVQYNKKKQNNPDEMHQLIVDQFSPLSIAKQFTELYGLD